jgi:BirA family biotin operon repressor/biotin-[acetyl-CoA-carboxylase] ligase
MKTFEEEYDRFLRTEDLSGIVEPYNAGLINRGREVRVLDPQGEYNGVARGINNSGELIVELADGTLTNVYAGEVSVRGIYGYV